MPTTPTNTHPHQSVFGGFDDSVEHVLGADMRLIYGMAAPILMIVGFIVVLALSPATWLVIAIVVLEIAALGLVVTGFMTMMNEEPEDQDGVG